MARKIFSSFHYKPDNWRASQVRNIGAIEGNKLAADNDWETITKGGETAIKRWIDEQMSGRSCVVVLAGSQTANRKWINYEIKKGWNDGKGVVVIYIHKLEDRLGNTSTKGLNPLDFVTLASGKRLSSVAKAHDPRGVTSKAAYKDIADNIEEWIEEAIKIRKEHAS